METERVKISQLQVNEQNPRTCTDKQFEKLVRSVITFPKMLEVRPIVVGDGGVALGGNMRLRALQAIATMTDEEIMRHIEQSAKYKDRTEVERVALLRYWQKWQHDPTVSVARTDNMTEDERREFIIKDNVGFGDWDWEELANNWDGEELGDWGLDNWGAGDSWAEGDMAGTGDGDTGDTCGALGADGTQQGTLIERFVVPPFSVLDTKQGYWQDRKRQWLELTGNLSETRDGEFGTVSGGKESLFGSINNGTSNFDPVLAEIIFKWFAPKGGRILDPFGGEQTKGVVAGELGLEYEAVEFRADQVELNNSKTAQYPHVHYTTGDSNNISKLIKARGFDLCFTSPPYYDLEVYSKDDMSALGTYEEFMEQYENIFSQCVDMLGEDAFVVVKICEIRDKKTGIYRNFVGDNIAMFRRFGLAYYNEIILCNAIGTAAVRANNCMRTRKVCKVHQNVLVFYKGDVNNIAKKFPVIEYSDAELGTDGETEVADGADFD